jgi:hypothetical protein
MPAMPRCQFSVGVVWSAVAFERRGVPRDDLQRSLDALGEVTIHVVGNPAGNLIKSAGTGDNLED